MEKTTSGGTASAFVLAGAVAIGIVASIVWAAPEGAPGPGFAWKDGGEVYAKVCALCHETSVGPMLRGRSLDPTYVMLIVRHGNRAMPAFRASEIDDKSLEQLAEHVSKSAAGK